MIVIGGLLASDGTCACAVPTNERAAPEARLAPTRYNNSRRDDIIAYSSMVLWRDTVFVFRLVARVVPRGLQRNNVRPVSSPDRVQDHRHQQYENNAGGDSAADEERHDVGGAALAQMRHLVGTHDHCPVAKLHAQIVDEGCGLTVIELTREARH